MLEGGVLSCSACFSSSHFLSLSALVKTSSILSFGIQGLFVSQLRTISRNSSRYLLACSTAAGRAVSSFNLKNMGSPIAFNILRRSSNSPAAASSPSIYNQSWTSSSLAIKDCRSSLVETFSISSDDSIFSLVE
uniref:Uncharacterized protein n=1 Tax=Opuntia streptacantha TaxID=393608 RepID=A0A7C9A3L8_OPUST